MGLDSYLGRFNKETNKLEKADDLVFPEVHLCGGMFSGDGSNGSFRGKVYATFVKNVTGQSLFSDGIDSKLDVQTVAHYLRKFVDEHKSMQTDDIVEPDWDVTYGNAVDLCTLFEFASAHRLDYMGWW